MLIDQYEAKTNDFADERLLAVAISYATEDHLDKATTVYERFLQDHPRNTRALRGLGFCYFRKGDMAGASQPPKDAILYLSKAWALGDTGSLVPLGACYLATKQYDQMELLLPSLLKQKQGDADVVSCLVAYALAKDPPREDLLLSAIEGIPDKEILVRDDLAQLLAKAVERLRAIAENEPASQAILRKVVRGYEADKQAWPKVRLCAVADAYCFLGERSEAEPIYRKVLENDPDNQYALTGLGAVDMYAHRFPDAIAHYRRAWSLGNEHALQGLGAAYLLANDLEGMKDILPALLARKAQDLQILNSLIAYALNKSPKDKEFFFKAIEGIPEDQILRRQDTTEAVAAGLRTFGEEERARRLLKQKEEQDKGRRA
ncbi:MAG TPA: hypothetical protein VNZ64_11180 [Candidatus Acidoferrum sp.]|nr:hypothetical protein [Candidatus Acidoferrum sp.]